MKTKIGLLMALMVLTTIALVTAAQTVEESEIDNSKLDLRLSTSQNRFIRAEPIPFSFILMNQGSAPIPYRGSFGLGSDVNIYVQNPDGTESKWAGGKLFPLSPSGFGTARPNEPLRNKSLLNEFKTLDQIFPRAGRYIIRIEFLYRIGLVPGKEKVRSVTSNAIEIEIVDPIDRDREAYNFIVSRFITNESRFTAEEHERDLKEFVDKYADSVYGKYLAVKLANTYHVTGRDHEAVRELCKVSGESFYFSDEISKQLALIDEKLHPTIPLTNLPENARAPVKPHPCARPN